MRGRGVAGLAAVHAREPLETTLADVTEAVVGEVDRGQLAQGREIGKRGECGVVDILAADAELPQRRHLRERKKAATAEVRADATPEAFERLRAAERDEAVVGRGRLLRAQVFQARDSRDVPHRGVV